MRDVVMAGAVGFGMLLAVGASAVLMRGGSPAERPVEVITQRPVVVRCGGRQRANDRPRSGREHGKSRSELGAQPATYLVADHAAADGRPYDQPDTWCHVPGGQGWLVVQHNAAAAGPRPVVNHRRELMRSPHPIGRGKHGMRCVNERIRLIARCGPYGGAQR